ncbi:N-acetyltransferase [Roseiconus nitratireducens]|uniref:N-acetyltransferase n=1 Tax=Roseiconus nitratireducens TaxID=2605748 RepID=A0A5M6DCX9_9BACT|nr:N-acetyltransferase [Roseiconus nitratireducens]KAA5545421.1 N-acetyltransferase [Roseiconus nitratireducens]
MSLKIRTETAQDRPDIENIHRLAFGGDEEVELITALRGGGFVTLSLVAELDGEVVGHLLISPVAIKTEFDTVLADSLAPLAVLPRFQRQGIGTALVESALQRCRRRGATIMVVLGQPEFYTRFGFDAKLAHRLESPFGSGDAWMALELVPGALTGVEGRVEYPKPFDALLP